MIRVGVYARVSSEAQSSEDKVSIQEQLSDCQRLCDERGYQVVMTLVDDKRYRSGSRLVEPSGQRADRPKFKTLIQAAYDGEIDYIVSWKEDRLVRGIYAAAPFGRMLEDCPKIRVELVHGVFNRATFFLMASIAKIEIDNIRERSTMGISAKLRRGEAWDSQKRFGYLVGDDNRLALDPERAPWVEKIFEWYVGGVGTAEIRRRLIAGNAPSPNRKNNTRPAKAGWALTTIRTILSAEEYYQGFMTTRRGGSKFHTPCPPIISQQTFEKARQVAAENKNHARTLVKEDFLLQGIVYCAEHNLKWKVKTGRWMAGKKLRKTPTRSYLCTGRVSLPDVYTEECTTRIGALKLETYVVDALTEVLRHPERVRQAIDEQLAREGQEVAEPRATIDCIERGLESLPQQRSWVITQARLGRITEQDMAQQLEELEQEELSLHAELKEATSVTSRYDDLKRLADDIGQFLNQIDVREDTLSWGEILHQPEDVRRSLYDAQKILVDRFVERVILRKGELPEVVFKFGLTVSCEDKSSWSYVFDRYIVRLTLGGW